MTNKTYRVSLREVHTITVEVLAFSLEEAIDTAIEDHREGLENVDFFSLVFSHIDEASRSEWVVRDIHDEIIHRGVKLDGK